MTLNEIKTRKAEIRKEVEERGLELSPDRLTELEAEAEKLNAEERALNEAAEKREAVLKSVIAGAGDVIAQPTETRKDTKTMYNVSSPEYREAFLLDLQGRATPEQRTAVSASVAIPTQTLNKIYAKLEQTSVLYPHISKSNIPGYLSIPVENAKNDAAWVAMGTAATDGADSFSQVTLSLYKLIKTVELTADNVAASIDAFENFIVEALAKKIAKAVDVAICTGDGSSKATGLLASGVITNTGTYTKAAMVFGDITKIISALGSEYRKNAKFVMPSAVYFSDFVPALASKGIGVDTQLGLKNQALGYEVILDDNMTADSIVFGDLSYYHWNWGQEPTIERDNSIGFRTGSVVYRAMALADGKVVNAAAFAHFTRSAT